MSSNNIGLKNKFRVLFLSNIVQHQNKRTVERVPYVTVNTRYDKFCRILKTILCFPVVFQMEVSGQPDIGRKTQHDPGKGLDD